MDETKAPPDEYSDIEPSLEGSINFTQSPEKFLQRIKWESAYVTKRITEYLAAAEIANPEFPSSSKLQKFFPLPFTNSGHQVQFDAQLFHSIIWKVICDLKGLAPEQTGGRTISAFGLLLFFTISSLALLAIDVRMIFVFFIMSGISAVIYKKNNKVDFQQQVADIRAKAIEQLINGTFNAGLSDEVEAKFKIKSKLATLCRLYGNGRIDDVKMPLLLVDQREHPFPGYGYCQINETIIAPSSAGRWVEPNTFNNLVTKITRNIKSRIRNSSNGNITFGNVICIHDSSILIDSPFLDREKRPVLSLNEDELTQLKKRDTNASVRKYFAIQLIDPTYMNTTTLFIRPFLSGNAMAMHICLTTLGPPHWNNIDFQEILANYRKESKARSEKQPLFAYQNYQTNSPNSVSEEQNRLDQLRMLRRALSRKSAFQAITSKRAISSISLKKFTDLSNDLGREFDKEFDRLVSETPIWPGGLLPQFNYREANSFTFTSDFFGRFEAQAMVQSLYSEVFKSMIDTLEQLGFDVSSFKDEKGHYTINAEKIDRLVVGEKIEYKEGNSSPEKKSAQGQSKPKKRSEEQ